MDDLQGLLQLRGTFLTDVVADTTTTFTGDYNIIEPLPKVFRSKEEWPMVTSLQCLICNRTGGVPIPIITRIGVDMSTDPTETQPKQEMETYGVFCSFSCPAYYIENVMDEEIGNKDPIRRKELHEFLKRLYEKIHGKTIDHIPLAPKPTRLEVHGGKLTPYEYGQKLLY